MKKGNIKNFFKGTSFFFFWLFVGILIGGFVLSYVQGWLNQLLDNLSFATGMMAIGTFVLAFFTYWSIRSRNAQEQRNRKEQYLNEILEWLREIEDGIFTVPFVDVFKQLQDDTDLITALGVTKDSLNINRQLRTNITDLDNVRREIRNAQYFNKVALKLNPTFVRLINNILCLLEQRRTLIMERAKYPLDTIETLTKDRKTGVDKLETALIEDNTKTLDGLGLTEKNINTILMGRNAGDIKEATNKAIKEAIDLKYII